MRLVVIWLVSFGGVGVEVAVVCMLTSIVMFFDGIGTDVACVDSIVGGDVVVGVICVVAVVVTVAVGIVCGVADVCVYGIGIVGD